MKEFMYLFVQFCFTVNLHAPTRKCTTINESIAGAFGIPEVMLSTRRWTFISKQKRECKKFWIR